MKIKENDKLNNYVTTDYMVLNSIYHRGYHCSDPGVYVDLGTKKIALIYGIPIIENLVIIAQEPKRMFTKEDPYCEENWDIDEGD